MTPSGRTVSSLAPSRLSTKVRYSGETVLFSLISLSRSVRATRASVAERASGLRLLSRSREIWRITSPALLGIGRGRRRLVLLTPPGEEDNVHLSDAIRNHLRIVLAHEARVGPLLER